MSTDKDISRVGSEGISLFWLRWSTLANYIAGGAWAVASVSVLGLFIRVRNTQISSISSQTLMLAPVHVPNPEKGWHSRCPCLA